MTKIKLLTLEQLEAERWVATEPDILRLRDIDFGFECGLYTDWKVEAGETLYSFPRSESMSGTFGRRVRTKYIREYLMIKVEGSWFKVAFRDRSLGTVLESNYVGD